MLTQNSVSFSCQSKQLSRWGRCCINFTHELTCQILTNQSIKIERGAWPTRDHGKKRSSPPVFKKNWLNFCVWGQFQIKIVIVRGDTDTNTTYLIWIEKKVKYSTLMGRHLSLDTVRWYWSADTLFWQLSIDDNIDVQSASSWAPKVARKCEGKHWYACGADGRSVTWLPNFLGWVDYLSNGAPPTRARSTRGAPL